jgi:hypothetical protein
LFRYRHHSRQPRHLWRRLQTANSGVYGGGYPVSDDEALEFHNLNRLRGSTARRRPPLPDIFGFVALFLSRQNRNSFVGDIEERYRILLRKQGRRSATLWFWRQMVHSFLSLALDALKRISGFERLFRRIRG